MGVRRPSDRERPVHPHDTLLSHPAGLAPVRTSTRRQEGRSRAQGGAFPWEGPLGRSERFSQESLHSRSWEPAAGGERYPHLTTGPPHFIRTFPRRVWSPFSRPQIWTATELLARNLQ